MGDGTERPDDKLAVRQCSDCPFYYEASRYYPDLMFNNCNHPDNDGDDEPKDIDKIPAWCPLRKSSLTVGLGTEETD